MCAYKGFDGYSPNTILEAVLDDDTQGGSHVEGEVA